MKLTSYALKPKRNQLTSPLPSANCSKRFPNFNGIIADWPIQHSVSTAGSRHLIVGMRALSCQNRRAQAQSGFRCQKKVPLQFCCQKNYAGVSPRPPWHGTALLTATGTGATKKMPNMLHWHILALLVPSYAHAYRTQKVSGTTQCCRVRP